MNFPQPKAAAGVSKDTRVSTAKERSPENCQTCGQTDREYSHTARICSDPWHADDHLRGAGPRTLPSSDQCVAREALEKIAGRREYSPEDYENAVRYKRDEGLWTVDEYLADSALAVPQAAVAETNAVREALTLGRDAVMESFYRVSDKADQDIADMRLRSIDAALAFTNPAPTELKEGK